MSVQYTTCAILLSESRAFNRPADKVDYEWRKPFCSWTNPEDEIQIVVPGINKYAPVAPECCKELCQPATVYEKVPCTSFDDDVIGNVDAYVVSKITGQIEGFRNPENHIKMEETARKFRSDVTKLFPDASVWLYGSFASGVNISTSDLDFSVRVKGKEGFQLLRELQRAIQKTKGYRCSGLVGSKVPVLKIKNEDTKIEIDVTSGNHDGMRNSQLLACCVEYDTRFQVLARAVKHWASETKVEGSADGKLNGCSICLLLVNFLQVGVTPPVLPSMEILMPGLTGEYEVVDDDLQGVARKVVQPKTRHQEKNTMEVGALFLAFLKYYSQFDFENEWISVRRGATLPKQRDEDGKPLNGMPGNDDYIVVEDPFLQIPKNCGYTLQHPETFKRLQLEFKYSFDWIVKCGCIFEDGTMSERRRALEQEATHHDRTLSREYKEHVKNGGDEKTAPHKSQSYDNTLDHHVLTYVNTPPSRKAEVEWPKVFYY